MQIIVKLFRCRRLLAELPAAFPAAADDDGCVVFSVLLKGFPSTNKKPSVP